MPSHWGHIFSAGAPTSENKIKQINQNTQVGLAKVAFDTVWFTLEATRATETTRWDLENWPPPKKKIQYLDETTKTNKSHENHDENFQTDPWSKPAPSNAMIRKEQQPEKGTINGSTINGSMTNCKGSHIQASYIQAWHLLQLILSYVVMGAATFSDAKSGHLCSRNSYILNS